MWTRRWGNAKECCGPEDCNKFTEMTRKLPGLEKLPELKLIVSHCTQFHNDEKEEAEKDGDCDDNGCRYRNQEDAEKERHYPPRHVLTPSGEYERESIVDPKCRQGTKVCRKIRGINSSCDGRIWRVDTGASRAFDFEEFASLPAHVQLSRRSSVLRLSPAVASPMVIVADRDLPGEGRDDGFPDRDDRDNRKTYATVEIKHAALEKKDQPLEIHQSGPHNMQVDLWGAPFWMVIHTLSFNYPAHPDDDTKMLYALWMQSLGGVLPCEDARGNYPRHVAKALITMRRQEMGEGDIAKQLIASGVMETRDDFSRFCHQLHVTVSISLGKDTGEWTYKHTQQWYENLRARCLSVKQEAKNASAGKESGCTRSKGNRPKSKCRVVFSHSKKGKGATSSSSSSSSPASLITTTPCSQSFSEQDFASRDGFQTAFWGPLLWLVIHSVSFAAGNEVLESHIEWLLLTGRVLPCRYCRENFAKNCADTLGVEDVKIMRDASAVAARIRQWANQISGPDASSAAAFPFAYFCFSLHNTVRKMLDKTPADFQEIQTLYASFDVKNQTRGQCLHLQVLVCERDDKKAEETFVHTHRPLK